jgi:hypothetical protein
MTYKHYAVVNEVCPVCCQGRVLVAAESKSSGVFALCEDCESEWSHPDETHDTELASRDRHAFARYLRPDELMAHSWYCHVLNK